jgi:hypothetical protein
MSELKLRPPSKFEQAAAVYRDNRMALLHRAG